MNTYKLIALDMDGTLLNSKKKILPETLKDIETAVSQGMVAALSTGRGVKELTEYTDILSSIRYGILMNGAIVYDLVERKALYSALVEEELAWRYLELSEKYDAMIHYMTEEASYVREDQITHMHDFNMGIYQPMFQLVSDTTNDMRKVLSKIKRPNKMLIYFRSPEDRQKAYEEVKDLPLSYVFEESASLEATPPGVDKGSGLQHLADYLGIPMNQVAAIGDSFNDKAMLEVAGYSVAMENAVQDVKMIADAITGDNDHNGVGEVIRGLVAGLRG